VAIRKTREEHRMSEDSQATDRLLEKLRTFVAALDDDERQLFAALVGPGVALAYRDTDDVVGFGAGWEPHQLPDHLAALVRESDIRVVGL
jgi:hypothetical protein